MPRCCAIARRSGPLARGKVRGWRQSYCRWNRHSLLGERHRAVGGARDLRLHVRASRVLAVPLSEQRRRSHPVSRLPLHALAGTRQSPAPVHAYCGASGSGMNAMLTRVILGAAAKGSNRRRSMPPPGRAAHRGGVAGPVCRLARSEMESEGRLPRDAISSQIRTRSATETGHEEAQQFSTESEACGEGQTSKTIRHDRDGSGWSLGYERLW